MRELKWSSTARASLCHVTFSAIYISLPHYKLYLRASTDDLSDFILFEQLHPKELQHPRRCRRSSKMRGTDAFSSYFTKQ